jgi:DASS family divalent anion:Na+ symporter
MLKSNVLKTILLAVIILLSIFIPPPDGLTKEAWILAGIYLSAIVGLVIKPYPEPVIMLVAVALTCFTVTKFPDSPVKSMDVLSGYASGTTWLVFSAFTLSAAFVTTGLGKRLAYWFILKFGSTTLRLGYVTALLDLVLAPLPQIPRGQVGWFSLLLTVSRPYWGQHHKSHRARPDVI